MKTRFLVLVCGLALVCGLSGSVGGEALYKAVSATATSQTIPLGSVGKVTILNTGANEIYYRLFYTSDTPADVTTTNGIYLAVGASIEYGGPQAYGSISIVCDTAETATVRLYYQ